MTRTRVQRCPTCRREVGDAETYPFCSDRCRLVDLGKWLGEDYRVPAEPVTPEEPGEN